jgi:pyridoxal phosphate enzyme (YggS family)
METVRDRLERAKEAIASALEGSDRAPGDVRIMAVTKLHPPETVREVIDAGIGLIGENRVSEGGRKIRSLGRDSAEFHLIGPPHRKEIRQALRDFHSIDAVDRLEVALEIVRRLASGDCPRPGVLLEVNTSGEGSKAGFEPGAALMEEVLGRLADEGLVVDGFLTVGPLGKGESGTRAAFARLRRLRDGLSRTLGHPFPELSMGMSDDFHWAAAEGATTVRLGRYLLGERPERPG